jgi:hypothetical protein
MQNGPKMMQFLFLYFKKGEGGWTQHGHNIIEIVALLVFPDSALLWVALPKSLAASI